MKVGTGHRRDLKQGFTGKVHVVVLRFLQGALALHASACYCKTHIKVLYLAELNLPIAMPL